MIRGAEAFRSVEGNIEDIELVRCQRARGVREPMHVCTPSVRDPGEVFKLPR